MEEVWEKIDGFSRYEVSNCGKVRSYAQNKQGKIMSASLQRKGYLAVSIIDDNGKKYTKKLHRLVAEAFIPNPNNLPQVNHKDENKENNYVDNLEWCDNNYNINYGTKVQRTAEKNRCCEYTSEKVYSVDINGNIEHFNSICEAERITGLSHCNIVRTLKGRTNTCGGRKWYYENSQITNND